MTAASGTIFNIQRFSIHDGPGIRTTVFFKGCPLRCFWCHNPEGLRKKIEIQFTPARCTGCGECVRACPRGAQEFVDGIRTYYRDRCAACGQCAALCYAESLQQIGQEIDAQQAVAEVLRDRAFYEGGTGGMNTGGINAGGIHAGGVTLSGGEPMLQPALALEILAGCKANGIHTALETTTHYHWDTLAAALPLTDLFLIDIKHMVSQKHRAATGVGNEQILDNIRRLAGTGKPIIFRTPVIPGFNDTIAEIIAIARFIQELDSIPLTDGSLHPGRFSLELLAFHKLAADKYASLGLEYPAAHLEPPTKEHMARLATAASAHVSTHAR